MTQRTGIDRRHFIAAAAGAFSAGAARAGDISRMTAYTFSFTALEGPDIRLAEFSGKPMLVVNTASRCGYTPQLAGLQTLFARFRANGLLVLGVPSNDFNQEPGHGIEIAREANTEFGVTFPLSAPVSIKGPAAHPFYKWAAAERPLEPPRWNFHKYLIGSDGHIASVFATDIEPDNPRVAAAIERQFVSEKI
jgi:glutathione peroxidase